MTDKLILHIGTHKTGTTTLQSMLESNSEALAANGFTYPAMPLKWKHAHINRNAYWLSKAAYQLLLLAILHAIILWIKLLQLTSLTIMDKADIGFTR